MAFKSFEFSSFPENFQKEVLTEITNFIKKGESLQLVGEHGVGSSILVRLITQVPKIKNKYFPPDSNIRFIALDANLLLERNPLTLTRLLLSLFGPEAKVVPDDNVKVNEELSSQVEKVISQGKLVIIIDHINEIDYPELKPFFSNLSHIYNKYQPTISFVFVSKKPLLNHKDLENFSQLGKLLTANVVRTPSLNKTDGIWFVTDCMRQEGLELNSKEIRKIIDISGGFPRTIRRIVEGIQKGYSLEVLLDDPSLHPSLAFHLEELSQEGKLFNGSKILDNYFHKIKTKKSGERFSDFEIEKKLTRNEEKALRLLESNKGKIVSRNEGIEKLWGSRATEISDHAYDQIIHRLRGKLKTARPKVQIETIRGRGHCLKIG